MVHLFIDLVALFIFFHTDIYRYIFYFPFSLLVSVYVYASVCDFVCTALLLPFVLGFCLSVFFVFLFKKIFFFLIIIFYFNNFILFYFILLYFILFYHLSFFSIFSLFYFEQ